jgi:carboxymethylenebutenolidase
MKRALVGTVLLLVALAAPLAAAQQVTSTEVEIVSDGRAYASYLAAPTEPGPHPAVVLIHSFNGLEPGYRTMTDRFAAEGFVVLALGWQTFERSPSDELVAQLMRDGAAFLRARADVDGARLGLTGFCAGGRYTMLLLPGSEDFAAGVAWYGFPYSGTTQPAALVAELSAPMLMIHGSGDRPSPIADIYRYATALDDAGAPFELKVYQGEPHGFMLSRGELRLDEVAQDAFDSMVAFFRRKL